MARIETGAPSYRCTVWLVVTPNDRLMSIPLTTNDLLLPFLHLRATKINHARGLESDASKISDSIRPRCLASSGAFWTSLSAGRCRTGDD